MMLLLKNIIINMKTKTPLIIDFGLSIPIKELTIENYSKYFYTFRASYYIWPIDVHIINYLIHINNELSKAQQLLWGGSETENIEAHNIVARLITDLQQKRKGE